MHRIDDATAVAALPTFDPVGPVPDGFFRKPDPVAGTKGTVVTEDFMNDLQENLLKVVESAGITPTKGRDLDLRDAIDFYIGQQLDGMRDYRRGFEFSLGTDTDHEVDVGPGSARDATNSRFLKTTATLTLNILNSGALGLGVALAADTYYHVFAIRRDSDGLIQVYGDTSITAANIPAGYTAHYRLGTVLTDSLSNLVPWVHDARSGLWIWQTARLEFSTGNPGTAAVLASLSVPPGIRVPALIHFGVLTDSGSFPVAYISSPLVSDQAPSIGGASPLFNAFRVAAIQGGAQQLTVLTDTSRQFRYRLSVSNALVSAQAATIGWTDHGGV